MVTSLVYDEKRGMTESKKILLIDGSKAKSGIGLVYGCSPYEMIKWTLEGYDVLDNTSKNDEEHFRRGKKYKCFVITFSDIGICTLRNEIVSI